MLTFFIHFGLSFRQADHWLASRLFCPAPPPPPTTPPVTFLMVLSLSTIINSGYFKNGPLEPG